ncbi:nucleotidyltransferase, partial [Clostridium saudiense]|nr:nucleotidyltransferase [Clostridium saudiense]
MNITGIITEYNPFHNGHLYHLTEAKKATNSDGVICIMSGNFVQRGGPAIVDKWKRTEMALECGVDLVLELPTFYAVSSAEIFARGAISILNSLGIVDNLYFGSECGNIEQLYKIAKILTTNNDSFNSILKNNLKEGISFAKAREKSLIDFSKDTSIKEVISSSNNILGIEYIKAILLEKSNIKPYTLKREGNKYNDTSLSSIFSSATSIRKTLLDNINSLDTLNNLMPLSSVNILKESLNTGYSFSFDEDLYKYLRYKISTNCVNFNNLYEISEGLDKKIIKEILDSTSYEDLILRIKSKRYTYTKISRLLTQIFIGFDNFTLNKDT